MTLREHVETRYVVSCDGCDYQPRAAWDGFGRPRVAVEDVRAKGWRVYGREHYCPACCTRLGFTP